MAKMEKLKGEYDQILQDSKIESNKLRKEIENLKA